MRKLTMAELNRASVDDFKSTPKSPVVLVLDNVRSMHNVGRDIPHRRCVCAGKNLALRHTRRARRTAKSPKPRWAARRPWPGNTPPKPSTAVAASQSRPATTWRPWSKPPGASRCRSFGPSPAARLPWCWATRYSAWTMPCWRCATWPWKFPQFGTKHSLNVGVAAGVVLWDALVKLGVV